MTVLLLQYLKLIMFLVLVGSVVGLSRVRNEGADQPRAALGHASRRRGR